MKQAGVKFEFSSLFFCAWRMQREGLYITPSIVADWLNDYDFFCEIQIRWLRFAVAVRFIKLRKKSIG